jgi:hypothetical protein
MAGIDITPSLQDPRLRGDDEKNGVGMAKKMGWGWREKWGGDGE